MKAQQFCGGFCSLILTSIIIQHYCVLCSKRQIYTDQWVINHGRDVFNQKIQGHFAFCFEDKCKCSGDNADCSRNYGKLTFVPKLPDNIRFLNFSFNNLTTIDRADFFQNVTYMERLDLGDNGLVYIHPQAFRVLTHLRNLFLNYNSQLNFTSLQPVFSVRTLEGLDVTHSSLGPLPNDLFFRFPLPRLQYIYWHENHLRSLNFTALKPLVRLRLIAVANNEISAIQPDVMPLLEHLDISSNSVTENLMITCTPDGESYFPRLTHLYLGNNLLRALPQEICLPKLQLIQLSANQFSYLYTGMFNNQNFPSLVELFLESNIKQLREIQKLSFNNSALERISLMNDKIIFHDDRVHSESFAGCPRMRNLVLDHNDFSGVADEKFVQLFGQMTELKSLFLDNCHFQQVTLNTFSSFHNMKELYMYSNELQELPDGVFDRNNLTHLSLRGNRLSKISSLTFSESTIRQLTSLDLSDNLFLCTCELMWFRDWIEEQPSLFAESHGKYLCSDRQNLTISSFYLPDQACLMTTDTYKFIVASVCLLTFILTLLSSLYRYRWHIRLVLYETFRDKSDARRRRLQEQPYNYDVFVSYAAEDLWWVQTRLMPELEQRLTLRLCVHQRDFLAGKNIVDNIVDSVNDSKKVLMVFSTWFARSHWCQFELAFCLRHVLEKDEDLIVVCLEDLASRDLTSVMMAVLKTNTYIQWQDQPEATASFWERLQRALGELFPEGV